MKSFVMGATTAICIFASPAVGQMVPSTVTASNGVAVTVHSDEFANRHEYSAPRIDLPDGFVLVARVRSGGTANPTYLTGAFVYGSPWRFYDGAIFRGGARADFVSTGRDVGRCSGGRYSSGCTLTESFRINVTPAQIQQFSQNGNLAIQIRSSRTTQTVMVEIPVSYFDAINEVSSPRR